MMRRAAVVLFLVFAPVAFAQSAEIRKFLNAATTLYENLEYEKALKQLKKAHAKAVSPDDEAKVSLLEGIVLADMGKEARALMAFKTAFGFDDTVSLPLDVSPKVSAIAEKARASVRRTLAAQPAAQPAAEPATQPSEREGRRQERQESVAQTPPASPVRNEAPRMEQPALKLSDPPLPAIAAGIERQGLTVRSYAWVPGAVGVVAAGVATGLFLDAAGKHGWLINGTAPLAGAVEVRESGKVEATLGYAMVGVAVASAVVAVVMIAVGGRATKAVVAPSQAR